MIVFEVGRERFEGIEFGERDAQSDEPEAGACPGEEGTFVCEVVAGYAAGIGDGLRGEEFEEAGHFGGRLCVEGWIGSGYFARFGSVRSTC